MNKIKKGEFGVITVAILAMFIILAGPMLLENNSGGQYQIKRSVMGDMSVRMTPGPYWQGLGEITTIDKGYSLFYTADKDVKDDVDDDNSIEVTFNQSGKCKISSTMRVRMPSIPQQCINLVTVDSFMDFSDVDDKLLRPTVRKAMKRAASLMSSIESAKERRSEYTALVIDQLENGTYVLVPKDIEVVDNVSGETIKRTIQVIARDPKTKAIIYEPSPLVGKGISIENYEVKDFDYETKVQKQIDDQRDINMGIQTERAQAALEEQKALTIKATKNKELVTARLTEQTKTAQQTEIESRSKAIALIKAQKKIELEEKAKEEAEVKANKVKALALIAASERKEVAVQNLKTALIDKKAKIASGEGIAKFNRLINSQGATPEMKLKALVQMNADTMKAFENRAMPEQLTIIGSSTGTSTMDAQQMQLMNLFNKKMMDSVNADLGMKVKARK